jgi:hypothetical protein
MRLSPSGCPVTGLLKVSLQNVRRLGSEFSLPGRQYFGWNKKLARSLSKSREVLASRLEYLDAAVRFCRFTSQWLRADLRWTQTMIEVQIVFTVGVITARNKCS